VQDRCQQASPLEVACNATNVTGDKPVEMDAALGDATTSPS
jgi:hypothetical protein